MDVNLEATHIAMDLPVYICQIMLPCMQIKLLVTQHSIAST